MIALLEHTDPFTACRIHRLFQRSYAVEAELLGVVDFPPLRRTAADIASASSQFFGTSIIRLDLAPERGRVQTGIQQQNQLAGVIEIDASAPSIDIASLVVDPDCFRQGVGHKLISHALEQWPNRTISVETGARNRPAIGLYQKLGFELDRQWSTAEGIDKVALIRACPTTDCESDR